MDLGKLQVEYIEHEDESCYRLSRLKLQNMEVKNVALALVADCGI